MSVKSYYTSLETRLGNALFFGGRSHLPYYPSPSPTTTTTTSSPWTWTWTWAYIKSLNPFPIYPALLAMEDHLFTSLHLDNGGKVLDAGCGNGDMAIYFTKKGLHVNAIDLLPEKVALARRNVEDSLANAYKANTNTTAALQALTVQEGDYHNLDTCSDNEFDAVYTIETLAHATDLHTVMREFYRVLKPGGRLVLYEYDHWESTLQGGSGDGEARNEDMAKVHQYGGISPQAGHQHHHADAHGADPDVDPNTGLAALVQQAGFTQIHTTDLTPNVRPLLRFLVICCFIPYLLVTMLGLEAMFINTVALVVNYRRGCRYVTVVGRKPLV